MSFRRARISSSSSHRQSDSNSDDVNERFIEACASGDHKTVSIILESIKDFNIDVTDDLGRTALRLAVSNENIQVLEALLSKCDSSKLREALLLSIYMGHTHIAESILKHPQYKIFNDKKLLNGATDSFWQTPSSDDAQFSPDITPIMLASQYNRIEIVQMLLLNGDRIEKPHDFNCKCNECHNRFKFDSLRHAQSRLNAYRGLASESYISLASIDPILTSFQLRYELNYLAGKEKYFKSEYLQLAKMLSDYSVKLLSNVRGRDELEIVLNKTGKEKQEKYGRLSRLDLAIKYQEMPFVAHPNCQQKLVEIWYTGIRKIIKMNQILIFLILIGFIFFIPIGSIIFMFAPKSKLGKFMSLPCIKFITFTISYLAFIAMLIASNIQFENEEKNREKFSLSYPNYYENFTVYFNNNKLKYKFEAKDFYIRKNDPSSFDIAICVWLLGLFLNEMKKAFLHGIKDYLFSWSNIITCIMSVLFTSSYGLKYYTIIRVQNEKLNLTDVNFWTKVTQLNENKINDQIEVYKTFYWLNNDRYYWMSLDPINLSEGLYAIAIIFSFSRLCFWLPANQNLGPLQITFGKMIIDILKFILIFTIVFSGFLFGLHNLYWYYESSVRKNVEIKSHMIGSDPNNPFKTNGEERFGTVGAAFITMFFSLYALGGSDDVVIEPYENKLTPTFGYILFGMYHISNITVLMSMLIAMMTKSFQTILEHSDTEWKFSRSRLYMEFIKEGSTLPIPLNIVPTPNLILKILKNMFCYFKSKSKKEEVNTASISNTPENSSVYGIKLDNENSSNGKSSKTEIVFRKNSYGVDLTYRKVMDRVVKRYLLHNNKEGDDLKESDLNELKQDVQIARFDMLNDMREARENFVRYTSILHKGLSLLGENFFKKETSSDINKKFKSFKSSESVLKSDMKELTNIKYKLSY